MHFASILLSFFALFVAPVPLAAHGGNPTLIQVIATANGYDLVVRVSASGLEQIMSQQAPASRSDIFEPSRETTQRYISSHIQLLSPHGPCLGNWSSSHRIGVYASFRAAMHCDEDEILLVADPLFELPGPTRVIVSVRETPVATPVVTVLRRGAKEISLSQLTHTQWQRFVHFCVEGVRHILSGADHLLFVCGVMLVAGWRRKRLLLAISGFTLAHTISLCLSVIGRFQVDPGWVEPLVALSIVYIGYEALVQPQRLRYAKWGLLSLHALLLGMSIGGWTALPTTLVFGLLAFAVGLVGWLDHPSGRDHVFNSVLFPFCFGLVHGLAFAGPMLALQLPTESLLIALLGFNLGVEFGQLGVVATLLVVVAILMRTKIWNTNRLEALPYRAIGSGVLMLAGTVWFVLRI